MRLLDPFDRPGGVETITQRPVWRVRHEDGSVWWAYVEPHDAGLMITGYAAYPVTPIQHGNVVAGALVGASSGAAIGGIVGGVPGAVIGGLIGLLFGAKAGE